MADENEDLDEQRTDAQPPGDQPDQQDDRQDSDADNAELDEEIDEDEDDDSDLGDDTDDEPPPRSDRQPRSPQDRARQTRERIQGQAREIKDLKAKVEQLTRQPAQPQKTRQQLDAEFRDSIAHLTPDERAEAIAQRSEQLLGQQISMLRFETQAASDLARYEAKTLTHPVYAKHQDEVERIFQENWARNTYVPRDKILAVVIGERALKNAGRAETKQRKRAQVNQQRQSARPGGGRSDTQQQRGKQPKSARQRLEDVTF